MMLTVGDTLLTKDADTELYFCATVAGIFPTQLYSNTYALVFQSGQKRVVKLHFTI